MNDANVIEIGMDAMVMAIKAGGPTLLTALLVGVFVGIFQSATQLQEATVAFVPKLLAVGAAILLTGNWTLQQMMDYTKTLWAGVPGLVS